MTEALEDAQDAVLAHLQPAEVLEPSERALDFPAPPVASQLPAILVRLVPFIPAIRRNQFDAPASQPSAQRVAVVSAIRDDALRAHSGSPAPTPRHPHGRQGGLGQGHLVRRRGGQQNSERYTLAIGQYHGFRALATLCFTDCEAPFLAALASDKA